ncbi:hypothetical protein BH09ACT5_BH09ACT5_13280 [soil metagenome]
MTNAAPPGWYTHPDSPGLEHWWDGTRYTQSRPVAQQGVVQYSGAYGPVRPAGVSPKSRTVASILGFFLGGLGVDRFYLGNIGLGVAKLLVGWLTLGIWPLVDWITILAGAAHDGDGLAVTEWS